TALQLPAEKKMRRDEHRSQSGLHALLEVAAFFRGLLIDPDESLNFLRRKRTAKGSRAECRENGLYGILEIRLAATGRKNANLCRWGDDGLRRRDQLEFANGEGPIDRL